MLAASQCESWLEEFAKLLPLSDPQWSRNLNKLDWARRHRITTAIEGWVTVESQNVLIRAGITTRFPNDLPYIQLVEVAGSLKSSPPPHIEFDGNICYVATREMFYDRHQPVGILLDSVQRALNTLGEGLSGRNEQDYIEEFTSYWNLQFGSSPLPALETYFTVSAAVKTVALWREEDLIAPQQRRKYHRPGAIRQTRYVIAADGADDVSEFRQEKIPRPGLTGLYVPLSGTNLLKPPLFGKPWRASDLRYYIRNCISADNLALLDAALQQRPGGQDLVILAIPRSQGTGAGKFALVAVHVRRMKAGHVLAEAADVSGVELHPMSVERRDRAFLLQRGGGRCDLGTKRVLLVGCGAIGGHLAIALAASGVRKITLVDNDILSDDNIHRHALGRRYIGLRKVIALEKELRSLFPYVDVSCSASTLDRALDSRIFSLSDFDLVISATGNAVSDLYLNEAALMTSGNPPVVFSWLEPLGIGGHALIARAGTRGCLQCLFSDRLTPFFNRASLSADGQDFSMDAVGCGTFYAPFADLDARRTAELAVRTSLDVLENLQPAGIVLSWKGDSREFISRGFRVSARYSEAADTLLAGVPVASPRCPVCA